VVAGFGWNLRTNETEKVALRNIVSDERTEESSSESKYCLPVVGRVECGTVAFECGERGFA
jgi:hypothetical protein